MIDTITSLSFSVFSQKGRYALLLGSGVSRSAGILTGYEITKELIKQIAGPNNKSCAEDPEKWYREEFNKEPDYSDILSKLGGNKPSQIKNILRPYFEPNEDEKAKGLKIPTEAHKAIARLVKEGYIKVIITTNFDRLIENAIIDINKPPYIISTPDAIKGMEPLEHLQQTDSIVIKVNGDYLDIRIKNTEEDLKKYNPKLKKLIKDIFEKYGLIICGWSGEYDIALRDTLTSVKNRRYSTYCTYRSPIKPEMQNLINNRQAETIQIENADVFFKEIADRVLALKSSTAIHPASKQIAVELLKKYLKEDSDIDIHDLVMKETEHVVSKIKNDMFPKIITMKNAEMIKILQGFESISNTLISLFNTGIYFEKNDYKKIWKKSFETITNYKNLAPNYNIFYQLLFYPALLLLYSAGISSVCRNEYEILYALLIDSNLYDTSEKNQVIKILNPFYVIQDGKSLINTSSGSSNPLSKLLPHSNHLFYALQNTFKEIYYIDDEKYQEYFDSFEYLYNLIYCFETQHTYAFPACFYLRYRRQIENKKFGINTPPTPMDIIKEKAEHLRDDMPILKAGFFKKSVNNLLDTITTFDNYWKNINWY